MDSVDLTISGNSAGFRVSPEDEDDPEEAGRRAGGGLGLSNLFGVGMSGVRRVAGGMVNAADTIYEGTAGIMGGT